ncbi:uncharacterized protein LOC111101253 [Crassostrea virginica]
MESTWLRYLWDSRPNSLIVSGVVTTAVAYGLYRVFRWLQESKKGCAQFDEYFENIENKNDPDKHRRLRVLVVGLDGSGKTAFVECLGKGQKENGLPRPTVGFNIKSVTIGDTLFDIWDVGGSELCRKYWKEFVKNIHVIVWVVDSSATEERLQENSAVLKEFLDQPVTENIPVLFVANKQDKKNALRAKEVVQKIKADSIINKSRPYVVVGTEIPPGGRRKGIFLAYQNLKFLTSK